jgi:hypothetical protein
LGYRSPPDPAKKRATWAQLLKPLLSEFLSLSRTT